MRRLAAMLSIPVAACAGSMAPLEEGAQVTVIEKPMPGCTYVMTANGRSHAPSYALNNLRNYLARAGATHVVVINTERLVQGGLVEVPVGGNSLTISGIGYRCGGAAPATKR